MAYKLSERHQQDAKSTQNHHPDRVDLGKVATVCILFGLLGLLTAWFYSMETGQVASTSFRPHGNGASAELGPLNVRKYNEVYSIKIRADLASQSWSFVEGQVLNHNKQYLFSFGKELSYYSGRSSDGAWVEKNNDYAMSVTFPKPGTYYLKFSTESSRTPSNVKVTVSKKRGSSVPHLWFGGFLIMFGGFLFAYNKTRNIQSSLILTMFVPFFVAVGAILLPIIIFGLIHKQWMDRKK